VNLITERDVEITTVPKKAVFAVAGLTKVFAVRDGKAAEVRIPPGIEGDSWLEVPAGTIKAGELVAVSNLGALVDNAPVRSR
jgi:multidrug efflux pump subunit AcrA (membrane-fusion protein)